VVASAIGGITKQIVPGTGILLRDPTDLTAFGLAVTELLAHPGDLVPIGARAREHVLDHFVTDKHLLLLAQLMVDLSG
jgi:glycosyltransferase involved in cell wall biosynthesis